MDIILTGLLWLYLYIAIGVMVFIVTWICFVLFENLRKLPKPFNYILAPIWIPAGIIGYPLDILWNVFYATAVFRELPDFHKGMSINDLTLSHRLRQIFRYETKLKPYMIRWKIAECICEHFIEPSDTSHCGRFKPN